VFLAFIAAGAVGGVLCWSDSNSTGLARFGVFLLIVGGWVVSLSLHEFAHAYAAHRAGDTSIEGAGYLTLNPLKYAHPLLSIVLPVIFIALGGIGLPGGAVYLHPNTFRTRWQRSVASGVGPLMNVAFAVIVLQVASGHDPGGPHGRFRRAWTATGSSSRTWRPRPSAHSRRSSPGACSGSSRSCTTCPRSTPASST
jgi:hypothetical protein